MRMTEVKSTQQLYSNLLKAKGEKGKIAIFASGNGTNAENIITYFKGRPASVELVVSDNSDAGVLDRASRCGVETLIVSRREVIEGEDLVKELQKRAIDLIVLAGYLGKIGASLLKAFPDRILNLHPALLPKYGGKGMYGDNVHEAVLGAGELESGITIHLIDEEYDKGQILCQSHCLVDPQKDTIATLAHRIHRLEYIYYPIVIEDYLDRFFSE